MKNVEIKTWYEFFKANLITKIKKFVKLKISNSIIVKIEISKTRKDFNKRGKKLKNEKYTIKKKVIKMNYIW